jgi:hypothetical protein
VSLLAHTLAVPHCARAQYGPPFVLPSVYERDASLRMFLLLKCINANLAALRSPGLAAKVAMPAKLSFLNDVLDKYGKAKVSSRKEGKE